MMRKKWPYVGALVLLAAGVSCYRVYVSIWGTPPSPGPSPVREMIQKRAHQSQTAAAPAEGTPLRTPRLPTRQERLTTADSAKKLALELAGELLEGEGADFGNDKADEILAALGRRLAPAPEEGTLREDEILKAFLKDKIKEIKGASASREPQPTQEEAEEVMATIRKGFGKDISLRTTLKIAYSWELAARYESAEDHLRALVVFSSIRDLLWHCPKQHILFTLDMVRTSVRAKEPHLAFDIAAECAARFPCRYDQRPGPTSLISHMQFLAEQMEDRKTALMCARLCSLLKPDRLRQEVPLALWDVFRTLDPDLAILCGASWPTSREDWGPWLEQISRAYASIPKPTPSPDVSAFIEEQLIGLHEDKRIPRARMQILLGRECKALETLIDAGDLMTRREWRFLSRLLVITNGDPRVLDPTTPQFAALELSADYRGRLAQVIRERDPDSRWGELVGERFIAEAESAVVSSVEAAATRLQRTDGEERLLTLLSRCVNTPAFSRCIALLQETQAQEVGMLLAKLKAMVTPKAAASIGVSQHWLALLECVKNQHWQTAIPFIAELEQSGSNSYSVHKLQELKEKCELGLTAMFLAETLAEAHEDAAHVFRNARAAFPGVTLQALFEAGKVFPRDLASLDDINAQIGSAFTGKDRREFCLLRAKLLADACQYEEAQRELTKLSSLDLAEKLTATEASLTTRLAREIRFAHRLAGFRGKTMAQLTVWMDEESAGGDGSTAAELVKQLSRKTRQAVNAGNAVAAIQRLRLLALPGTDQNEDSLNGLYAALLKKLSKGRLDGAAARPLLLTMFSLAPHSPHSPAIVERLADTFGGGQPEERAATIDDWFRRHVQQSRADLSGFCIASCFYHWGEQEKALACLRDCPLKDTRIIPRACLLEGLCHLRMEQSDKAKGVLGRLVRDFPGAREVSQAMFLMGWIDITLGDNESAADWLNKVIANGGKGQHVERARALLERIQSTAANRGG